MQFGNVSYNVKESVPFGVFFIVLTSHLLFLMRSSDLILMALHQKMHHPLISYQIYSYIYSF